MTEVAATQPRPAQWTRSAPESAPATRTTPGLATVDSIATYIPTEVVAAYIASLAALVIGLAAPLLRTEPVPQNADEA
jgi:hypothetical protein